MDSTAQSFTCTDLAQPSMLCLTVHIIPRPTPDLRIQFEFSARFHIIFIVWLTLLPVLELQLQEKQTIKETGI